MRVSLRASMPDLIQNQQQENDFSLITSSSHLEDQRTLVAPTRKNTCQIRLCVLNLTKKAPNRWQILKRVCKTNDLGNEILSRISFTLLARFYAKSPTVRKTMAWLPQETTSTHLSPWWKFSKAQKHATIVTTIKSSKLVRKIKFKIRRKHLTPLSLFWLKRISLKTLTRMQKKVKNLP